MKVKRIDKVKLTSYRKTDEGFLEVTAPIARTGIYIYYDSEGNRIREWVPPETLFDSASVETLQMKPVTNDHPENFVGIGQHEDSIIGTVGQTFLRDGDKLNTQFIVNKSDGIKAIEGGTVELSPGYLCEVDIVSGVTPDGEQYDSIQRSRTYNHLAVVDCARGGESIRIYKDSKDIAIQYVPEEGDIMKEHKVKIDGVEYGADSPVVASHIDSLESKLKKQDGLLVDANSTITEQRATIDTLEAEVSKLKKDSAEDVVNAKVAARLEIVDSIKEITGKTVDLTKTDSELLKEAILSVEPEAKFDGIPAESMDIYLKARFDAMKKYVSDSNQQSQREIHTLEVNDSDNQYDTAEKNRQARIDRINNAYKEQK